MTFFICLLCLVAGIAMGVGFTQVICTGMVNDTNKMWLNALKEMDKLENQSVSSKTMVYKNVTVIANDNEFTWQRQPDTEEMTYEEWESQETEQNKENS